MKAGIFFIFLCFLLLRMSDTLGAVALFHAPGKVPVPVFQIQSPSDSPVIGQPGAIIDDCNDARQYEELVYEDIEDDDSNDVIIRNFKLLPRCSLPVIYSPGSVYPVNRSKAAPSFCGRISYKYILQRVLRV